MDLFSHRLPYLIKKRMVHWSTEVQIPSSAPVHPALKKQLFSVLAAFRFGCRLCFCFTRALSASIRICLSVFGLDFGLFAIVYFGLCSSSFLFGFFFFVALALFESFLNGFPNDFGDEGNRFGCVIVGRNWEINIGRV